MKEKENIAKKTEEGYLLKKTTQEGILPLPTEEETPIHHCPSKEGKLLKAMVNLWAQEFVAGTEEKLTQIQKNQ